MPTDSKMHWENLYRTKQSHELSWTQDIPSCSLELIRKCTLPKSAPIIDVGGGDSKLVDYLLAEGYEDITVLDISQTALERATKRLGEKQHAVKWINSDMLQFKPRQRYALWHDRAAFHFLREQDQIRQYVHTVIQCVSAYLVLGTFSALGPPKCSGLDITQYSEEKLASTFSPQFTKLDCQEEAHQTPFDSWQHFLFCRFQLK